MASDRTFDLSAVDVPGGLTVIARQEVQGARIDLKVEQVFLLAAVGVVARVARCCSTGAPRHMRAMQIAASRPPVKVGIAVVRRTQIGRGVVAFKAEFLVLVGGYRACHHGSIVLRLIQQVQSWRSVRPCAASTGVCVAVGAVYHTGLRPARHKAPGRDGLVVAHRGYRMETGVKGVKFLGQVSIVWYLAWLGAGELAQATGHVLVAIPAIWNIRGQHGKARVAFETDLIFTLGLRQPGKERRIWRA